MARRENVAGEELVQHLVAKLESSSPAMTVNGYSPALRAFARNPYTPFPVLYSLMQQALKMASEELDRGTSSSGFNRYDLPMHILHNENLTVPQGEELNSLVIDTVDLLYVAGLVNYMFLNFRNRVYRNLHPGYSLLNAYRQYDRVGNKDEGVPEWVNILVTRKLPEDIILKEWEYLKTASNYEKLTVRAFDVALLVTQTQCPSSILVEACRYPDAVVRQEAAKHPNCPEESRIEVILSRTDLMQ